MKRCRDDTVEEVTVEWQRRASYHPLQVRDRVLAVYKAKLEAAQRSDCHRAQFVARMTEAVVERLKQAGLTLMTQESPISPEPLEQPDLEPLNTSRPPEESADPEGWQTVKSRGSRFWNSNRMERRKLIVWVPDTLRVREFVAVARQFVCLNRVRKFIRRKTARASRIELIFAEPADLHRALDAIQAADFPWEARAGRPYEVRQRDRQRRETRQSPEQRRGDPLHNPFEVLACEEPPHGDSPEPGQRRRRHRGKGGSKAGRKEELTVGTLNVQGMAGKEAEILELLQERGLDVLVLTETWETGMQAYLTGITSHRYFALGAKSSRAKRGRNKGGCGILVSRSLEARPVQAPDDEEEGEEQAGSLLWVQVGPPSRPLFIGAVYGPQATEKKDSRVAFYQRLTSECLAFQSRGHVLVLGDFNARLDLTRVESEHVGPYGEKKGNANGALFLDWLETANMFSLNGRRRDHGLYTRIRGKEKSIIDYIVCDEELFRVPREMHVLEGYDIGSDHRPLVATLQVATIDRTNPQGQRRLKTWRLRDPEIAQQYREALARRLSDRPRFPELSGQDQVEAEWRSWKEAVLTAAEETLGRTCRSQGGLKAWWNKEVLKAIKERRRIFRELQRQPNANWKPYQEAARRVREEVRRAKRESWEAFVAEIESTMSNDTRTFFRLVSRLDGGKRRACSSGLDLEQTATFFERLGRLSVEDRLADLTLPDGTLTTISRDQVAKALASLRRGKAVSDEIATELLKEGGEDMVDSLHELFQLLWTAERVPQDFVEGLIVPIHKQGAKNKPENYRGITLMNAVSKCYSKVTIGTLSDRLEAEYIEEEQGGFRVHRACDEQFFALHTLLKKRKLRGEDTYLMFVDFQKAFDSVPREKLLEKLRATGADGKPLRVIRSLYRGHSARVRIDDKTSRPFDISLGVKQGCVMSTELFKVFVNDLIWLLRKEGGVTVETPQGPLQVSCLMFADDLVLTAESLLGLQRLTDALAAWCEENELGINVDKTKVMVVGKATKATICLLGKRVEVVPAYKYLGIMLSRDLKWTQHVTYIMEKVKRRMAECHRLLSHRDLPPSTRLHLYRSLILPVMTYGAGLWHLTDHQSRQLEALHLKALKAILGTCTTTTSAAVYAECGLLSVEALQEECMLKLAGRISRMSPDRLVSRLFRALEAEARDEWHSRLASLLHRHDLRLDGSETAHQWNKRVSTLIHARFAEQLQDKLAQAVKCANLRPQLRRGRLQRADYLALPSRLSSFCFKLRAGSLRLAIEEGRMKNMKREERLCPLCQAEVEDTAHFVLRCPALDHERRDLLLKLCESSSTELPSWMEPLVGLRPTGGEEVPEGTKQRVLLAGLHTMWARRCTLLHLPDPTPAPIPPAASGPPRDPPPSVTPSSS
jgi:exonuclease III